MNVGDMTLFWQVFGGGIGVLCLLACIGSWVEGRRCKERREK